MSEDEYYREWLKAFHHKPIVAHPPHRGNPVRVGDHAIGIGGTRYLVPADLDGVDLIVPLVDREPLPFAFGRRYHVLAAPLPDFGGVPPDWPDLVRTVAGDLAAGRRVLAFCAEGHGRSGCLLGSLIAVLETAAETPDPIAAARRRHCALAVETAAQAEAIFALRGEPLPQIYQDEFGARERIDRALFERTVKPHGAED